MLGCDNAIAWAQSTHRGTNWGETCGLSGRCRLTRLASGQAKPAAHTAAIICSAYQSQSNTAWVVLPIRLPQQLGRGSQRKLFMEALLKVKSSRNIPPFGEGSRHQRSGSMARMASDPSRTYTMIIFCIQNVNLSQVLRRSRLRGKGRQDFRHSNLANPAILYQRAPNPADMSKKYLGKALSPKRPHQRV
jgi:hypothetical protein